MSFLNAIYMMLHILIPRQIGFKWCNSLISLHSEWHGQRSSRAKKDFRLANKIPSASNKRLKPPSKPQLQKWWRSSTILGGSDARLFTTLLLLLWVMDKSSKFNMVNFIMLYK
jgi:hypothetical protein